MHFHSLLAVFATATIALASPVRHFRRVNKMQFAGVTESGPELNAQVLPGVLGKDYIFPSTDSIDTFIGNGFNTFRIPVLMERLAPRETFGRLNAEYVGNLTATVNYITGQGAYAMISPQNGGRYYGRIIHDTHLFKEFWTLVASVYKDNDQVIFDANSDYHDMSTALVARLNQAAIDGIRAAGATSQFITVEGNEYSNAWKWTTPIGIDGKSNAEAMVNLADPSSQLIYNMHQFLDADGSGTSSICPNSTTGSSRIAAATDWLTENRKLGLLGKYAGGVNNVCESAVSSMLVNLDFNAAFWTGALWFAAGPWSTNYMFSLEPTNGTAYSAYLPILKQFD